MTAVLEHSPGLPGDPGTRDTRGDILAAAALLFAERGYGATSVREVVEAAGCKKPTLYYYFQNKEQLYLEVIRTSVQAWTAVVDTALAEGGTVHARLLNSLSAYLDRVRSHPVELKLLMSAEQHPERGQPHYDFDAVRQYHIDQVTAVLSEGVHRGELRDDFDFEEAALALFGMIDHRLNLFLHGRPLPQDLPQRLLDLFFNGVRAS